MAKCSIPAADAILDQEIRVLDKGFVRLVDYMGGDERVVQAARVSYGEGTKSYRQDRGLIHYLMKNQHTSPFEQVQLTFHVKLPVMVARQWVRHRTARMNEISGRYSIMKDEFYLPDAKRLRLQGEANKQSSSDVCVPPKVAAEIIAAFSGQQAESYRQYTKFIEEDGLARELSRLALPLSLYTEWYWQIDLHNLLHFLRLRRDKKHAQEEIRKYADVLFDCALRVAPLSCEAFEEHWLYSTTFSQRERLELQRLLQGKEQRLTGKELVEFNAKIEELGDVPDVEPAEEFLPPTV